MYFFPRYSFYPDSAAAFSQANFGVKPKTRSLEAKVAAFAA